MNKFHDKRDISKIGNVSPPYLTIRENPCIINHHVLCILVSGFYLFACRV